MTLKEAWVRSVRLAGKSAMAAALLPRPAAGSRLAPLFRLLDVLAANWLNARNAKP